MKELLDTEFNDGLLICRLFLGLSKDQFVSLLRGVLGDAGIGVKSYRSSPAAFTEALFGAELLEVMYKEVNRELHWSDVLVERLRSGRGSAIAGQRRGRGVEDFAESIVKRNFGNAFHMRCKFSCAAYVSVHNTFISPVILAFLPVLRHKICHFL